MCTIHIFHLFSIRLFFSSVLENLSKSLIRNHVSGLYAFTVHVCLWDALLASNHQRIYIHRSLFNCNDNVLRDLSLSDALQTNGWTERTRSATWYMLDNSILRMCCKPWVKHSHINLSRSYTSSYHTYKNQYEWIMQTTGHVNNTTMLCMQFF